jgi:hypothetical protein
MLTEVAIHTNRPDPFPRPGVFHGYAQRFLGSAPNGLIRHRYAGE